MDMKRLERWFIPAAIILVIIAGWATLLYFYTPEEIVNEVGPQRGYLLAFAVATFGGVSTITSSSFYTTIYILADGGLNPFYLGIIGGLGITIGDSLFFYLGYRGKDVLKGRMRRYSKKLSKWIKKKPKWLIEVLTFFYAGFTPFPNDVLMIALAISNIRYKMILPALLAGNLAAVLIFSYFASKGIRYFL